MVQDLESLVLRIGNAKGRFRVISTEIQPKMTLSQVLEKSQIPFYFGMRVNSFEKLISSLRDICLQTDSTKK